MTTPIHNSVEQKWENEASSDNALSAILDALNKTKAIVITGTPGIGKSSLAHQAANNVPVIIVEEALHLEQSNGYLYETLASLHENGTPIIVTTQRVSPRLQHFIDQVQAEVISVPLC